MVLDFIEHKEHPNIFFINANTLQDKIDLGALLSRYSRTHKSAKELYKEEFVNNPDRGAEFYRKVFAQYGDESIAELVPHGFAVCIERVPLIWSTNLLHYRLLSAIEKSTRYMKAIEFWKPDDAPKYYEDRCIKRMKNFVNVYNHAEIKLEIKYSEQIRQNLEKYGHTGPITKSIQSKSLDYARMELPRSTLTSLGIIANLRSWLNILSKEYARYPFSIYKSKLLEPLVDLFQEHFPTIFDKFDDLVRDEGVIRYGYMTSERSFHFMSGSFEIIDASPKFAINHSRPMFDLIRAKKHKMNKIAELMDFTIHIPKIDYATFRDVQRHRMFSIYITDSAYSFKNEWDILSSPMAYTRSVILKANLRAWTHAIELRTQPPGHYKYRELFQRCGKLIADYIGLPKEQVFPFACWASDQEVQLGRTQAELKRLGL